MLQPLAIKPPKSDIQFAASFDTYITHSRGLFFSLLRMSWAGSDEEGRAVGRLNFQLEDITSVHQKFSTILKFTFASPMTSSADLNYALFASKRLSRHATESVRQPETYI